MDTIIQRLFVRVHSRYTRSPHLADLSAFVSWLNGQGYHPHYTRQLVFLVMRALDASPVVPGSTWRTDDLGRAFRRTRRAREYHQAGRAFRRFLGSVGRLTPSGLVYPHERLIETYRHHLSAVRGLATDSIVTHLWEVGAFLRYLRRRGRIFSPAPQSPLLCTHRRSGPRAYSLSGMWDVIHRLFNAAGIRDSHGRSPRVHDLRHSFAIQALIRWYRMGADVQSNLPKLALFMGHVSIESSAYYLRWVPTLRDLASKRFEGRFGRLIAGGVP